MEINLSLVIWLLVKGLPRPRGLDHIATMGSGPLEEHQFDSILKALGIQVYVPDKEIEILVIGREEWGERVIRTVLDGRSGLHLRVYSQEMFLAYLISGVDPLDDDEREVRALAGDHPALTFLGAVGFRWPTTEVPGRGSGKFDSELLRLGFLKHEGYTVGKAGLTAGARRRTLTSAYERHVPAGFPPGYVSQWGAPGSSKRLRKMAVSIAAFCRNHKKKGDPSIRAISDWESDLAWLKRRFYNGRFRFRWPKTDVW